MLYTPYEISLIAKSRNAKITNEFERIITLAWHTEAFSRQKKLPKLDRVLKDIRKKPKKQNTKSDEILKAMAREKGVEIP